MCYGSTLACIKICVPCGDWLSAAQQANEIAQPSEAPSAAVAYCGACIPFRTIFHGECKVRRRHPGGEVVPAFQHKQDSTYPQRGPRVSIHARCRYRIILPIPRWPEWCKVCFRAGFQARSQPACTATARTPNICASCQFRFPFISGSCSSCTRFSVQEC